MVSGKIVIYRGDKICRRGRVSRPVGDGVTCGTGNPSPTKIICCTDKYKFVGADSISARRFTPSLTGGYGIRPYDIGLPQRVPTIPCKLQFVILNHLFIVEEAESVLFI